MIKLGNHTSAHITFHHYKSYFTKYIMHVPERVLQLYHWALDELDSTAWTEAELRLGTGRVRMSELGYHLWTRVAWIAAYIHSFVKAHIHCTWKIAYLTKSVLFIAWTLSVSLTHRFSVASSSSEINWKFRPWPWLSLLRTPVELKQQQQLMTWVSWYCFSFIMPQQYFTEQDCT